MRFFTDCLNFILHLDRSLQGVIGQYGGLTYGILFLVIFAETGLVNRVLQKAVTAHPPALHQGKRLKFYYTTQVATRPPTFAIYVNYPKGVHFSYYRYLVNQFRAELKLDQTSLRILLKERQRKDYGSTGTAGAA